MQRRVRASVICLEAGKVLVVRLRDPVSGILHRLPPGGAVEAGESPLEAAARELLEETGFQALLKADSESVLHYAYLWAGQTYDCQTHFFLGLQARSVQKAGPPETYVEGHEWASLGELETEWAFNPPFQKGMLQVIKDFSEGTGTCARKKT